MSKMEISKQIKKYRGEQGFSQEQLAQRIYVSRQTVSNWENEKSYPDVNSLVLLSEVFGVSVDNLIKGDLDVMKEQINSEDVRSFRKLSNVFAVLFFAALLLPIPLVKFLGVTGIVIWVLLYGVTMYFAIKVEKQKKKFDIQTYKEILSFFDGKQLDEIAKAREEGKRPYQKILLTILSAFAAVFAALLFIILLR